MNAIQQSTAFQGNRRPTCADEIRNTTSTFTSHRVIIQQSCSSWFEQLRKRLDELTALPVGWDGYNGQPVTFQCANFVANMLERLCQDGVPAPYLVPGSDGSLQVEWHRNMLDVELDVLDVQNVVATRINRQTGEENVIQVQNDFSEITDWISALADGAELIERNNV